MNVPPPPSVCGGDLIEGNFSSAEGTVFLKSEMSAPRSALGVKGEKNLVFFFSHQCFMSGNAGGSRQGKAFK